MIQSPSSVGISAMPAVFACFFFFNDTATTEIYTLSLHDALPISARYPDRVHQHDGAEPGSRRLRVRCGQRDGADRKSTRLNSSHSQISYAVFCLKKKKTCSAILRSLPSHSSSTTVNSAPLARRYS